MEYTSGSSSWTRALRRAGVALLPRRRARARSGWSVGVPLIALAAGLLFTTTARAAGGTALREDRRPELAQLIEDRKDTVSAAEQRAAALRDDVDRLTTELAAPDLEAAQQLDRERSYRAGAGFTAVHGPALTVRLNDAPRRADGSRPAGATNDDLVVHQEDVQAVVNALWSSGAEAMTIMGVRVISTSAVRCVGNTLLLHSRVYSPPFEIKAIGDVTQMRFGLDRSEGVRLFREAATDFGLGYQVTEEADARLPAYDSASTLRYAQSTG